MNSFNDIKVNKSYEIPYLAGYSKDGKTIYIDKRFRPVFRLKDGRGMDTMKYLVIHEKTEKIIEQITSYTYQYAHGLATGVERKAVESDGYPWDEYDRYMKYEIKRLSKLDRKTPIPKDYDEKPEIDSKDTKMLKEVDQDKGK